MNNYWESDDYITLPVKLVNGHWELLYGGDTGIKDGCYGELRVLAGAIKDDSVRKRLTKLAIVKVLDEDSELMVALRDRNSPVATCHHPDIHPGDRRHSVTRYEKVTIGGVSSRTKDCDNKKGGLWIRQRGVDMTELLCSEVKLPDGMQPKTAQSLNHACTLLSERFERHRMSHTINVYQQVYFHDRERSRHPWRPLDDLRNGVIAQMERGIVADAWRELEAQLGFRPIPPQTRRKGK